MQNVNVRVFKKANVPTIESEEKGETMWRFSRSTFDQMMECSLSAEL